MKTLSHPAGTSTIVPLPEPPNRANLPPMAKEFKCMICDQPERSCSCNKYCALCQSLYDARLCEDGIYYCRPCREACDLQAQVGAKSSDW